MEGGFGGRLHMRRCSPTRIAKPTSQHIDRHRQIAGGLIGFTFDDAAVERT
jgi:hypothetical protein